MGNSFILNGISYSTDVYDVYIMFFKHDVNIEFPMKFKMYLFLNCPREVAGRVKEVTCHQA